MVSADAISEFSSVHHNGHDCVASERGTRQVCGAWRTKEKLEDETKGRLGCSCKRLCTACKPGGECNGEHARV